MTKSVWKNRFPRRSTLTIHITIIIAIIQSTDHPIPQLLCLRLRKIVSLHSISDRIALFFEDRKGNRDNLIIDQMYSGDLPMYAIYRSISLNSYKKSKVILGFDNLDPSDQAYYRRMKKSTKITRYFQDVRNAFCAHLRLFKFHSFHF